MTIRLLAAYSIYPANAIVTLDAGTEAGLIAANQALADLTGGVAWTAPSATPSAGEAQQVVYSTAEAFAALSLAERITMAGATLLHPVTGAVLGVVDGVGNLSPYVSGLSPALTNISGYGPGFITTEGQILCDPADPAAVTLATWTGGTGTIESSRDVTFKGRPTLKITTLAATTRIEVGNTSGIVLPASWDGSFSVPIYIPDRTKITSTLQGYLGDSSYTNLNFVTVDVPTNQPWNGWHLIRWRPAGVVGETNPAVTGTPAYTNIAQTKLRINFPGTAVTNIYVGQFTAHAKSRAKIFFTADDGYSSWYSNVYPTSVLYQVPWAMGIDYGYVNTGGFMTSAQIQEMNANPLFCFYPHGKSNERVAGGGTPVGDAAYYANHLACVSYLQSIGVNRAPIYHPWVGGSYESSAGSLTSILNLKSAGVKIARTVTGGSVGAGAGQTYKPEIHTFAYGSEARMKLTIGLSLEAGTSLAQAKAAVDLCVAQGGTLVVMAHDFVTSGVVGLQWTHADLAALLAYTTRLANAGSIDIITAEQMAAATEYPADTTAMPNT